MYVNLFDHGPHHNHQDPANILIPCIGIRAVRWRVARLPISQAEKSISHSPIPFDYLGSQSCLLPRWAEHMPS